MAGKKGMLHYPLGVKLKPCGCFMKKGGPKRRSRKLGIRADKCVKIGYANIVKKGRLAFTRPIGVHGKYGMRPHAFSSWRWRMRC